MNPRRLLLVTLAGPILAGCGFQLRQPPRLGFASIALTGFSAKSLMAAELRLLPSSGNDELTICVK